MSNSTLTRAEIIQQIKSVLAHDLDSNLHEDQISEDISLFEGGLGLDSVNLVELIALLEKRFTIQFQDDELNPERFSTVATMADSVAGKLA
jgi:acyl carrier protein